MKRHNRFLTCVVLSALLCGGFGMASAADTAVGSGAGVAYGTGSSAPKAENVAIGKNAKIAYSGGVGQPSTGDIVIGGGAHTNNYIDQGGGIAIGANAFVENMVGGLERAFDFNQARYDSFFGVPYGFPKDPSKMVTGVAIGQNTYARSGSVMLGTHNYKGALGDTEVDSANAKADNMSLFSTTVGANSYTNGLFSSVTGSYSIASSDYNGGATNAVKNFGATITGSLNSIESKTASSAYSGIASSIIGVANRVYNSNGALVFGAGNEITNSVTDVNGLSSGGASPKELQNTLKDMIKEANGGGSTLAIGGGNKADYTLLTQISGVNNTITGTADKSAQLNSITGFQNTITNASNNIVMGDKHTVTADNTIAIGGLSEAETRSAANTTSVGYDAKVSQEGGVALGYQSNAAIDKGAAGYDISTNAASSDTTAAWKSTAAAVSVGDVDKGITRQITSVAAGTNDTDAVNVAQLKKAMNSTSAPSTHYYSIRSNEQGDGSNYNNDGATGREALAAGVNASAQGEKSTAIGYGTKTTARNTVAIGNGSQAIGKSGIAIGDGATAGSPDSNYLYGNIAIGTGANSAGGVAIGDDTKAGSFSLAVGINSEAGERAAAVGYSNYATGILSSALGVGNYATAVTATAVGNANHVDGVGSAAVGVGNKVTQRDTFVLGSAVTTTQANSVVLGAKSTDRAATSETKGTITLSDGTTREYGNFAGTSPTGVVSVGDKGKERQIINVAAGKISADSTDAVNGSQLYSLAGEVGKNADAIKNLNTQITNVTTEAGKHTTVKAGNNKNLTVTEGTNAAGGKEYTVDLSENINIDGPGKDGKDGQDGHMGINGKDGVSGVGIDGKDGISVKGDKGEVGINGNDGISIKGADGKDAVSINGKDGVGHIGLTGPAGTNGKDGTNAVDISVKNGYNGTDGTNGATGVDGKDGITRIVYEDKSGEHQVATLDDGMKYGGDSGDVIAKKLNNQVNVIGGIKDESKLTSADNIGVVSDGKDNLKVRLAKDLNGITSISNGGNTTITLGDNTVNMNNSTITNVKNGDISEGSTDVVNGGQVYNVTKNLENKINTSTTQLGNRIDKLGTRVNRVGAGAAALAALHPQDFDPDDKWDFAAGYGNYKDASAVAVGAFYRPNEDTMLSVGGSFGGGENMVNAGISVKLGQHSNVTRSRVALAKDVLELKKIVAEQSKMIQQLAAGKGLAAPVQKDVNFPDVPKDHWAYTYVKSLADRGYLEGYPDGEFKGDRTMTRYEYAAIIYRALQNGAPVDADMGRSLGEFGPEIEKVAEADRFRVDRVAGKDNDRNKIERVRVNNKNDKANKVFKDVYGSTIQK